MRAFKVLKIVLMVIVCVTIAGYVVEHLWNCLMPGIFGLKTITYWQALGLLVLSKILLGGIHRHGGGRPGWKRHMEERFANMSPEERERLRAGMRGRCGFGRRESTETVAEQSAK